MTNHILYVSVTGDDESGDGSQDNPFRTAARAFREKAHDVTVQFGPGHFDIPPLGTGVVLRGASYRATYGVMHRPDP